MIERFNLSYVLANVIAAVVVFVLAYLLIKIIELWISRFIHVIMLSGLNRITGFVIGAVKGMIIILLVVYLVRIQEIFPQLENSLQFSQSKLLLYIESFGNWILSFK